METPNFIKSLNSWKSNEYNIDIASYVPKFYLPPQDTLSSQKSLECQIVLGEVINFDAESKKDFLNPKYPPSCIEQIDSNSWLKKYGLEINRLKLEQILSSIGFKHTEEYVKNVNKTVSSKYSKGLYIQTLTKNGIIYNITCNQNKLLEYADRLKEVINTYRKRLQWLNSDSRRICGLICERNVVLVIDCKQKDPKLFDQFRNSVIKTLLEQVAKLNKFNLIRCSHEIESFKEKSIQVDSESIDEAIDWLNDWSHCYAITANPLSTCESLLVALNDSTTQAVYLITEGTSSNGSRELSYDKLTKQSNATKIKLNVIAYNCNDSSTIEFLRRLCIGSYGEGRFHSYSLIKSIDDFKAGCINADPTKSLVVMNKKLYGGIGTSPGSGINKEVMLIFEEMQNAIEVQEHLCNLLVSMNVQTTNKPALTSTSLDSFATGPHKSHKVKIDEEYLSTEEWLKIYGLATKKLQLFDVLSHVAFRHCDGVVDIKQAPATGVGEAISREKLINAKYCDQFAHVMWNDGTIRHVHVTPEIHRSFEKSIRVALEHYDRRIKWLSKGSRELFGTVVENNIYILIDTSQSMQISLDFVKQKLVVLMQEQLKAKQRFNLVSFNNKVLAWRDRLVEVDEYNFNDAWKWIKNLSAQGTTNTLAAIKLALSDINTEAIYLLSDGRPDQSPRQILSQVQLNKRIPIHVISFNCNDAEANRFLNQLANETGGRYHYFNENYWSADPNGPVPFESKDIALLKKEIADGLKYSEQIANLRDECRKITSLSKKQSFGLCSKDHSEKETVKRTPEQLEVINEFNKMQQLQRPSSFDVRMNTLKNQVRINNKTSLIFSLNNKHSSDWMLPETRQMLTKQERKGKKMERAESNQQINESKKKNTKSYVKKEHTISETSIKEWLKMNSLAALKLRILDALGPVVVKQSATHIGILDKYVTSKVWNDLFPVTSVEVKDSKGVEIRNELKLLNPRTANLETYERKLKDQINIYIKYLFEKIWSSLPNREKEKLDNIYIREFSEENKLQLLKSLENSGWPIREHDINAVEREIELAYKYLQQSKDIRDLIVRKEDIIHKETISTTENEMKKHEFSERKIKASDSLVNKTVLARYDLHGYYYEAKVFKQADHRHVSVRFINDAEQHDLSTQFILRLDGTGSKSNLNHGDYVMALVINEFKDSCYVPGIVQSIDTICNPKLYTIMYFNGTEGLNVRNELISISKNRYGFASNYIRNRLGIEQKITLVREVETEAKKPALQDDGIDNFKKEIVDLIHSHFKNLRLDDKYIMMYEELLKEKQMQNDDKKNLRKEVKSLRKQIKKLIENKDVEPHYPKLLPETENEYLDEAINHQIENIKPKKQLSIYEELEQMRVRLPELSIGEEVLAKWSDDGWYYRSLVKQNCGNYKYKIEDVNKVSLELSREDIISESDAENNILEVLDPVVALHPSYSFSYAPGIIIKIANNLSLLVRFYDGLEAIVNKEEVYKIPVFKFEYDVDIIVSLEKRWVGQTVIARNPYSFVYELGVVRDRIGTGRQYVIDWSGNKSSVQTANHIFGRYTHNPPIIVNDHVLASKNDLYLPGRVIGTQGDHFRVKFVDNSTNDQIKAEDCYWLSRDYYEDACNFYRRKMQIKE